MPAIATNAGLIQTERRIINGPLTCRLFKSDVTPSPQLPLAAYVACTFPGYSDRILLGDWGNPTIDGSGQAVVRTGPLTWTRAAGLGTPDVFGYVLFWNDASGAITFAAERFSTPRALTLEGNSLTVQLTLFVFSAFN